MILSSDFHDYYDYNFSNNGKIFSRKSKNFGPSKQEQFKILKDFGYKIPPIGKAIDLIDSAWEKENQWNRFLVVYTDPNAHCGEGKILISKKDIGHLHLGMGGYALKVFMLQDSFSSAFLGNPNIRPSVSLRQLHIGKHVFWIEYSSNDSWMSNVGDGKIELVGVEKDTGFNAKYPLYAIDFVIGKEMYAIDLNIAPGIKGTGIEHVLSGKEVVKEIEEWFDIYDKQETKNN